MHKLNKLIIAFACAVPMMAGAQSTSTGKASSPHVKPPDQPSSELQKEQTIDNGQATKYGGPGTDTSDATSDSKAKGKTTKMDKKGRSNATAPGDAPTYPAPAKDGTPTK